MSILHLFTVANPLTTKAKMTNLVDDSNVCPHNTVIVIMDTKKKPGYDGDKEIIRVPSVYLQKNNRAKWELHGIKYVKLSKEEAIKQCKIMFNGPPSRLSPLDVDGVTAVWHDWYEGDTIQVTMPTREMSGMFGGMRYVKHIYPS
jgi:hypothetical protein